MNSNSKVLSEFLYENMPSDTPYEEVAYACRRIYCTLEGLPLEITNLELDKDTISLAFAAWTQRFQTDDFGKVHSGIYSASWHRPTDKGHWIQVISSMLSESQSLDLARQLPFRSLKTEQDAAANP
jgi:hypothetical protein